MYSCLSPAISHVFIIIDMKTTPQRTCKEKQSGPCLHSGFGEIGKDETNTNQQKTVHAHHIVVLENQKCCPNAPTVVTTWSWRWIDGCRVLFFFPWLCASLSFFLFYFFSRYKHWSGCGLSGPTEWTNENTHTPHLFRAYVDPPTSPIMHSIPAPS